MSDIIKTFSVRSYQGERPRRLRLYFDTGSPLTFMKRSVAERFKDVLCLTVPRKFGGLGNGVFHATHTVAMEVKLIGYWCPHPCYVVRDDVLEADYDILAGHDLMQHYDIRPNWRKRNVSLNPVALRLSQKVRSAR